ncbi:hypothetical protein [Terasakiella sp. SH-1]|uniref:hypothetical protein n=1 Tax=Terasakiella sp. SH-1 TaxID=2560057 RepID=UPI0010734DE9|nr:hypothetical protein [Terasakiella sp. SH-1]
MFSSNFSYAFYETILQYCQTKGEIIPLHKFDLGSVDRKTFVWRHDIDIDLRAAVKMAEVEAKLGIKSTYMVIPDSPIYDISSQENKSYINELQALGHEVALHFDIVTAGVTDLKNNEQLEQCIQRDMDKISSITNNRVLSISFHRPIQSFLHGPSHICGCVNAYAAELMDFYISDSKGNWRSGNPLERLKKFDGLLGQTLTHPIWWSDKHCSPDLSLEHFFQYRTCDMSSSQVSNFDSLLRETIPAVKRQGL